MINIPRTRPILYILFILSALPVFFSGCTQQGFFGEETGGSVSGPTRPWPGQNLQVRRVDGSDISLTVAFPYISALGEECVQMRGKGDTAEAACLRDSRWMLLPDIFAVRPMKAAP